MSIHVTIHVTCKQCGGHSEQSSREFTEEDYKQVGVYDAQNAVFDDLSRRITYGFLRDFKGSFFGMICTECMTKNRKKEKGSKP